MKEKDYIINSIVENLKKLDANTLKAINSAIKNLLKKRK